MVALRIASRVAPIRPILSGNCQAKPSIALSGSGRIAVHRTSYRPSHSSAAHTAPSSPVTSIKISDESLASSAGTRHALPNCVPNQEPLLTRRRQIPDCLSATSITAISNALSDYLPPTFRDRTFRHGTFLIHFGGLAQYPSGYLADGTDNFHHPGAPYNSRVWAGGQISFDPKWRRHFKRPKSAENGVVALQLSCCERIEKVEYKGEQDSGKEKVVVQTRRAYGTRFKKPAIHEVRDLVFMRTKTPAEAAEALAALPRVIKPPASMQPSHALTLTPRYPLLAEFSCLTHNAHRIHLDRSYAAAEGFRNLVVQGPLSLYLMLTFLERVLPAGSTILSLSYKNLVPLFCDEEMTICLRRVADKGKVRGEEKNQDTPKGMEKQQWDVWITAPHGGYAVKGVAQVICARKNYARHVDLSIGR